VYSGYSHVQYLLRIITHVEHFLCHTESVWFCRVEKYGFKKIWDGGLPLQRPSTCHLYRLCEIWKIRIWEILRWKAYLAANMRDSFRCALRNSQKSACYYIDYTKERLSWLSRILTNMRGSVRYALRISQKTATGRRRCRGCLKLWGSFLKGAIHYRALWPEMTYKDEASYASSTPCIHIWINTLYTHTNQLQTHIHQTRCGSLSAEEPLIIRFFCSK